MFYKGAFLKNWLLKPLVSVFLLIFAGTYLFRLIPDIDFNTVFLITFKTWMKVIALFIIVQILNVIFYYLILSRIHPVKSFNKLVKILFASHSLNYAGPVKLGIPLRVILFKKILGIPFSAGVSAVIITTSLDLFIILVFVSTLYFWIYISPITSLIVGAISFGILLILIALSNKISFSHQGKFAFITNFLSDLTVLPPLLVFCLIVLSIVKAILYSFAGWILLASLYGKAGFGEFSFIFFTSHIAGLLSFIPMGIGVKDASFVKLLSHIGVSSSTSIVFVAIDRIVWTFIPFLIGLFAGWNLGIKNINRAQGSGPFYSK